METEHLEAVKTATKGYFQVYYKPSYQGNNKHIGDIDILDGSFYPRHYYNEEQGQYNELCDMLSMQELLEIISLLSLANIKGKT